MSLSHQDILKELEEYRSLVQTARKKVKNLQYPPTAEKIKSGLKAAVSQADAHLEGAGHLIQGGLQYAQGMGAANLAAMEAGAKASAASALNAVTGWIPFGYDENAREKARELKSEAISAEQEALMAELGADAKLMAAEEKAQAEFNAADEIRAEDFSSFTPDLSFEAAERFFKNVEKNIEKIEKLLDRKKPAFCQEDPDADMKKLNLLIKHAKEDVNNDFSQLNKTLSKDARRGVWNNLCTSVSQTFESIQLAVKNKYQSVITERSVKIARTLELKNEGFPQSAFNKKQALAKAKSKANELESKLAKDFSAEFKPKKKKGLDPGAKS